MTIASLSCTQEWKRGYSHEFRFSQTLPNSLPPPKNPNEPKCSQPASLARPGLKLHDYVFVKFHCHQIEGSSSLGLKKIARTDLLVHVPGIIGSRLANGPAGRSQRADQIRIPNIRCW